MELDGSTALVTGGSRGVGRATCVALAERGCDVAVNARRDGAGAEETASLCGEEGVDASVHLFDVSDFDAVGRGVEEVERSVGPLDVLVNNAGVASFLSLEETSEEDWDRSIAVNLKGSFNLCRRVLPGMKERRSGRIVNVASTATRGSVSPGYAAAKTGLLGLTRFLAREGVPEILVNAVSPGPTRTEMTAGLHEEMAEHVPAGRIAEPGEIASAIVFVAGHDFISGENLVVGGGLR
ncbi:MAG: L-rhamnose 1-dehydrogenase (NADP(+)) [Methanonatronarchaeales archaeon]|nr:L-rhamnose 1-dehydrogenase (NADP(+)) [Methanonatronarchaeales archaeon]